MTGSSLSFCSPKKRGQLTNAIFPFPDLVLASSWTHPDSASPGRHEDGEDQLNKYLPLQFAVTLSMQYALHAN
eukprot:CAMPEP_0204614414 /NCGR_PEP_ID=MMETSP0717-20131115/2142_1 /ASSEMBLY_ACC=CAM_ASM_000666 /TAXON_ID=230516 /ORGANISM="Chaetoceros curvisetus" /LENGTH=72 /DNA_ID=CAMNT_0051627075 /DNA_START=148 /DNA_END=366 /DNA_ORIENTATION=-